MRPEDLAYVMVLARSRAGLAIAPERAFFVESRLATLARHESLPSVDAGGPYSAIEGGSIVLEAQGQDREGGALAYDWDLDGDGQFETPGQSVTFSAAGLDAPSSRSVTVRVTDGGGLSATDTAVVSVNWNFTGFFRPVENLPARNRAHAGSAIPLKFSLENTELEQKGLVTAESPSPYDLRVIAVSRLLLAGMLKNVSVYWVALGKKVAQVALSYGGNDMVGTAYSEEIFKAAGKSSGTSLQELAGMVREIKREPAQRDTFFNILRRL